ncbi:MAG: alkaline phosphatase [Salinivirgaceae bacterium]|nr:MAG: alkaline phosphatase [Salinivirgaceae bacterium]
MKYSRLIVAAIIAAFVLTACSSTNSGNSSKKAKYVFYFIGDGVSLAQLSLTEAYLAQLNKKPGMQQLNQSKLNAHGWFYNYAENRFITGSAAAGTALSTGHKTSINTIGKSADRSQNLKSISYKAKEAGMKVGIISTVSIDHATPAAFYANADKRNQYYVIGKQVFTSGFDLFAGGGFKYPKGRKDTLPDLYETESDISIIRENKEFLEANQNKLPILFAHQRLHSDGAMPFAIDMNEGDLTLEQIVGKSIELLDNPNGFFMMVEGGKIDWACHANDAATMIKGMIDFDNAIGKAIQFAANHPDETLIVVLGDHETGGLSLGNETLHYKTKFDLLQYQTMSHEALVEAFRPILENNSNFTKAMDFINKNLGLGGPVELNEKDKLKLKNAWKATSNHNNEVELLYGSVQQFLFTALQMLNEKAGVGWTTEAHTGLPVVVHAQGVNEGCFEGIMDNTDVPKRIEKAMGI